MEDSAQPYSLGMEQFVGDSLDESSLIKPRGHPGTLCQAVYIYLTGIVVTPSSFLSHCKYKTWT